MLAASGTSDVVHAELVEFACDGDEIVTTDQADIAHVAEASDKEALHRWHQRVVPSWGA
jgi:hypothetical protein